MKTIHCHTDRASLELVCYVNGCKTVYPENWPRPIPPQMECTNVDEIRVFIKETNAQFVMFGFRAPGIPSRAISVSDTEKLGRVFKAFERMMKRWPDAGW